MSTAATTSSIETGRAAPLKCVESRLDLFIP
jgi:hypothetical protein